MQARFNCLYYQLNSVFEDLEKTERSHQKSLSFRYTLHKGTFFMLLCVINVCVVGFSVMWVWIVDWFSVGFWWLCVVRSIIWWAIDGRVGELNAILPNLGVSGFVDLIVVEFSWIFYIGTWICFGAAIWKTSLYFLDKSSVLWINMQLLVLIYCAIDLVILIPTKCRGFKILD